MDKCVKFNKENWKAFEEGKDTTIRDHLKVPGIYPAVLVETVSLDYKRYSIVGVVEIGKCKEKRVADLTVRDAKREACPSLANLILRLKECYPSLESYSKVFVHECRVVCKLTIPFQIRD